MGGKRVEPDVLVGLGGNEWKARQPFFVGLEHIK